jgi:acid stress chaperone HdeB
MEKLGVNNFGGRKPMKQPMMALATILLSLSVLCSGAEAKKRVNKKLDMASYTCKDLLAETDDDVGAVLIWIDGYLSGKTGDTTIDVEFLSDLAEGVGEECGGKSDSKVLDVVQKLTE